MKNSNYALNSECVALYNYTGEVGDLSFSEGDVIKVHKDEGEWWEGSCRGEQGLFPANYVKKKETEVRVGLFCFYSREYHLPNIKQLPPTQATKELMNSYTSFDGLKGYGSIAHEAKPNGLLTRGP